VKIGNLRVCIDDEGGGLRAWWNWVDIFQLVVGRYGLGIMFETPTEWHERKHASLVIQGLFFFLYIGLPWWGRIAPDYMQCKGPTYGFQFCNEYLWIDFGQETGESKGPRRSLTFTMPWGWRFYAKDIISPSETHPYRYILKSGEVQERTATIQAERYEWHRPWLPWRKVRRYIDVQFSGEVGERTGSWKGGTVGCGYELKRGETPFECLRRMESERKF